MAEDSSEQNKSESATPFKLDRARRKGMIARGTDLGFVSALVALAVAAQISGAKVMTGLAEAMRRSFASAAAAASDPQSLMSASGALARSSAAMLALPVLLLLCFCVAIEIVQNRGLVFTAEPLKPDFSKLNPAKGLKRLFSMRLLKELAKNIVKFALYSAAAWLFISSEAHKSAAAARDGRQLAQTLATSAGRLLLLFLVLAAAIAILDQLLARGEFAKQMRMSRRDVTREAREREGEPRQKRKRKQMMAELIKHAAAASNVKGADVLIVNPTHYAVALRYKQDETDAPVIQARGRNIWAQRIREAAEREGITIIRSPALARALYREGEVGGQIGAQHYVAVADIYIMLRRAMNQKP